MDSEKITYIKYCPNVFLAKCEAQHEKGEIINVETRRGDLHECEVHNFIGRTKDGCYAYSITRTDGTNKATMLRDVPSVAVTGRKRPRREATSTSRKPRQRWQG